jgi:Fe(3+) dicitrate transport protein
MPLLFVFGLLLFQPASPDSIRTGEMPQIDVIGLPERLVRVPGSATVIRSEALIRTNPVSGNEVLRRVAGIHAVEEEGIGMRANIGIRGLDPDRSRTILVMEDGIPVALTPYGEPELYYSPAIDRMVGVEILKGSGSILFGPQTIGGVVNYITANPPAVPTTEAVIRGGQNAFFTARFSHGATNGNTGYQVNYLRKSGNGVGIVDYGIHDLSAKFKHVLAANSLLGLKVGVYDENSNSTYVGITQDMYDSGDFDFVHPAPDDRLAVRRLSLSATHDHFFTPDVRLRTTAFGYTTTRDWSRQDFRTTPRAQDTYIRTLGTTVNSLYFFDRTGNRNRSFEVAGLEPRLSVNADWFGMAHELDLGGRVLFERAFEKRIDGTTTRPTSGTLREDEIRTGRAISGYLQNRTYLNQRLSVTPGIRIEYFDYERDILRRANAEVDLTKSDRTMAVIPGIGLNHTVGSDGAVFAGIHRGFAPPRVKDAISNDGVSQELDAELSWNTEIGYRGQIAGRYSVEVTAFWMDFENQVIPVSESSGGAGQPGVGLVNGGDTRHVGLESAVSALWSDIAGSGFGADVSASVTYTNATFSSDRFVDDGGTTVNVNGNRLPYAPDLLMSATVDVVAPLGLRAGVTVTHTARQFGDVLNRETPTADGQEGPLAATTLIDLNLSWHPPMARRITVSAAVKNLTDERYISSRRPQGIRVGLPRFVTAGIEVRI